VVRETDQSTSPAVVVVVVRALAAPFHSMGDV
jgi:hypothetical protein